jgi:hypothetical protein
VRVVLGPVRTGFVQLEDAQRRRECADRRDPESILIAREEQIERDARHARTDAILRRIPEREALALVLSAGLFGHRQHGTDEIAIMLGVTPAEALAIVTSATEHVQHLAGEDAEVRT